MFQRLSFILSTSIFQLVWGSLGNYRNLYILNFISDMNALIKMNAKYSEKEIMGCLTFEYLIELYDRIRHQ